MKVAKQLAHKDAAGVSWIAAVEGEQQIQSWEVKDINLWAAARNSHPDGGLQLAQRGFIYD